MKISLTYFDVLKTSEGITPDYKEAVIKPETLVAVGSHIHAVDVLGHHVAIELNSEAAALQAMQHVSMRIQLDPTNDPLILLTPWQTLIA